MILYSQQSRPTATYGDLSHPSSPPPYPKLLLLAKTLSLSLSLSLSLQRMEAMAISNSSCAGVSLFSAKSRPELPLSPFRGSRLALPNASQRRNSITVRCAADVAVPADTVPIEKSTNSLSFFSFALRYLSLMFLSGWSLIRIRGFSYCYGY